MAPESDTVGLYRHLRPLISGRRIFFAAPALAGAAPMIGALQGLGAESVAVVSGNDGVGDVPRSEFTSIRVRVPSSSTMMEGIRIFQDVIDGLQPDLLDDWDPDRSAFYLAGPFDRRAEVAGRSAFGVRPSAFSELDDKTAIARIWRMAGVPQAPARIVPATRSHLVAAAARLDHGLGTVWVADNLEGWHGGGDYLRWVHDSTHIDQAVAFFSRHARRVRVMPFLDGIPCSIHGVVLTDRVLSFRPVEMVILRRPDEPTIQYAGLATAWDPHSDDRRELQAVARRVGEVIRAEVGYRGAFGIDGIMTAEGFRPTELNPRLSGGLGVQARQVPGLHLGLLNRLLLEGHTPDVEWDRLEATIVDAADARRTSRCMIPFRVPRPDWERLHLRWDGEGYRECEDPEVADAILTAGDHPMGCALLLEADPERTPPGEPFGPKAVAAIDLARNRGMDLPAVVAAHDVRRERLHLSQTH